ncbi:unnamed protein product [Darwinula stevensoni]|uniref:phosphoribosylformylglycinamidine cyclo-ligase n=1 Tax=Darwinula stevensoni TaxID=69355 RepID=A0A7R9FR05_9CRUS|nr:unnamed protein product [Darwinula stevensoni]CAG0900767.1 unnamed protein product [Darwinula stevensoni]
MGDALLTPTLIYVKSVLPIIKLGLVKGCAHITGGGLPGNVCRILPQECAVSLDAHSWNIPPVFPWIALHGQSCPVDSLVDGGNIAFFAGGAFNSDNAATFETDPQEPQGEATENNLQGKWMLGTILELLRKIIPSFHAATSGQTPLNDVALADVSEPAPSGLGHATACRDRHSSDRGNFPTDVVTSQMKRFVLEQGPRTCWPKGPYPRDEIRDRSFSESHGSTATKSGLSIPVTWLCYSRKLDAAYGDALLTPTLIYVKSVLPIIKLGLVKGCAHITGGGLPGNVCRILPQECAVSLDAHSWNIPPVFPWIALHGQSCPVDSLVNGGNVNMSANVDVITVNSHYRNVSAREMLKTFNLGLGMVLIMDKVHVDQVLGMLRSEGETAWIIGDVISRNPASCESCLCSPRHSC